jgi:hypothetical protein
VDRSVILGRALGVVLAGAGLLATQGVASQRSSAATPCPNGQTHRNHRFTEKGWRVTIGLDPCVPEPDARRILRAIDESRLVNRQPAGAADGRLHDIPKIDVRQVLSIALADERERAVAPHARYVVMTRTSAPSAAASGLSLLVSVLGDDVEAHFVTSWIE